MGRAAERNPLSPKATQAIVVARELGGEGPAQSWNNFGGKSLLAYRNGPDGAVPVLSEGILDVLLEIVNHELGTTRGQPTVGNSL